MESLEELIKQRDMLNKQIELFKKAQEEEEFAEIKSKYLNKTVRQYRKDLEDITFIKVHEVFKNNKLYSLAGNGIYLEFPYDSMGKIYNETIELNSEYDTTIVTEDEVKEELNKIFCNNFGY